MWRFLAIYGVDGNPIIHQLMNTPKKEVFTQMKNLTASTELKVRIPPTSKTWLKVQADANNRSMNAEILDLVTEAMKENPLEVVVHECTVPGDVFYTVSLGKYGDDFYEGPDRAAAFAVACAKAKELGLLRTAIRFFAEDFTKGARNA